MYIIGANTTAINVQPVSTAGTTSLQGMKIAGKPITITMPVSSLQNVGKSVTLSKHTVSNSGQIINVPGTQSVPVSGITVNKQMI